MNNILIASFDMELGGVERSLLNMLDNFDYERNQVDLMLYSHTGDLMHLIPHSVCLMEESKVYKTFRMSIKNTVTSGKVHIGMVRLFAKVKAELGKSSEKGYRQMQYMWHYALPFLPKQRTKYDVAISYLWPHYYVAEKVDANLKIAWIHTDFSMADTHMQMDIKMWQKYDYIMAVSENCRNAFIQKYPALAEKIIVMENITAPDIVRTLAREKTDNPMRADKRFKLVTVARLSYAKGIDQAVKAFKQLQDKGYHHIVWYIVGYGGDEDVIRRLIHENELEDSFILLGKKINPYPYIKEADLYVQPSRYEGKAVTVSEAQILGKPVLITNYPTARSQVRDGEDGIICDLSVEGIMQGIEMLYRDQALRNGIGTRCRNYHYNNNDELEKLYEIMGEG